MASLFPFRKVASALCLLALLYGSVPNINANEQTYSSRSEEGVEVLYLVIASEIKANDWPKSELICFSVNGLDPSAKLVKSLRQRNPNVRSTAEWSKKLRSKVIDLREINTGDAHIATLLKAGEYSLQKVDGKWSIKGYLAKPLE